MLAGETRQGGASGVGQPSSAPSPPGLHEQSPLDHGWRDRTRPKGSGRTWGDLAPRDSCVGMMTNTELPLLLPAATDTHRPWEKQRDILVPSPQSCPSWARVYGRWAGAQITGTVVTLAVE